jgi:hypothetical protein
VSDNERETEGRKAGSPASELNAEVQKELQREAKAGKGLIGDESANRNLSGSSTWETLPDPSSTDE